MRSREAREGARDHGLERTLIDARDAAQHEHAAAAASSVRRPSAAKSPRRNEYVGLDDYVAADVEQPPDGMAARVVDRGRVGVPP